MILVSRCPPYFSKPCLEVTSPRHTVVLQVSLFANMSISVKRGVKRHPNTNVKDMSKGTSPQLSCKEGFEAHWLGGEEAWWGPSWLSQKWRKIIITLNKAPGISRPGFLSNGTCGFTGSCVKHCSRQLQDLLLKCLSEHQWSSVTPSTSVDVLQEYSSTSGGSPMDVLDFHPQDKTSVRFHTSFL